MSAVHFGASVERAGPLYSPMKEGTILVWIVQLQDILRIEERLTIRQEIGHLRERKLQQIEYKILMHMHFLRHTSGEAQILVELAFN